MVRPLTVLVYGLLCLVLALAILSPLIPYAVTMMNLPVPLPKIDLYIAISISAVIALVVTFVFYKIALKNAEDFLTKAEV